MGELHHVTLVTGLGGERILEELEDDPLLNPHGLNEAGGSGGSCTQLTKNYTPGEKGE
ncbi:MAG: hypothetical protein ABFS22_08020 [Pseudomonadota bacterium]